MRRISTSVIWLSAAFFLGISCSPRSSRLEQAPEPGAAYERAVSLARSGDESGALAALAQAIEGDREACQRALLEPAFERGLRDTEGFRDAMRRAAVRHGISSLTLARDDEPGEWIEVEGIVRNSSQQPVPGALVYFFATDHAGRYHPEIPGEVMPRLFGVLVTDEQGMFHVRTVRPGPYPGTRNARHVHLTVDAPSMRLAAPSYAVFDDDPLLDEPQNAEQRGEATRIAMTRGEGGTLRGRLVVPMR